MNDRLKPSTVHVTSALVAGKELSPVICVDLDGTIIRTDTLAEALIAAVRKNPFVVLLLPLWLLQGRTKVKAELARRSEVDVTLLPYNTDVLAYLAAQRQRGTEVWLTTAAHGSHAHAVAQHLGIFTKVLSSNESINLKGSGNVLLSKNSTRAAFCLCRGFNRGSASLACLPGSNHGQRSGVSVQNIGEGEDSY